MYGGLSILAVLLGLLIIVRLFAANKVEEGAIDLVERESVLTTICRVAGRMAQCLLLQSPGGLMTTGDLLAELRDSRTDMARVVEAAAQPERAYVVVPIQAVKAWMEREPDAWAKVV